MSTSVQILILKLLVHIYGRVTGVSLRVNHGLAAETEAIIRRLTETTDPEVRARNLTPEEIDSLKARINSEPGGPLEPADANGAVYTPETAKKIEPWERRGLAIYEEGDGTPGSAKLVRYFDNGEITTWALDAIIEEHNKYYVEPAGPTSPEEMEPHTYQIDASMFEAIIEHERERVDEHGKDDQVLANLLAMRKTQDEEKYR